MHQAGIQKIFAKNTTMNNDNNKCDGEKQREGAAIPESG